MSFLNPRYPNINFSKMRSFLDNNDSNDLEQKLHRINESSRLRGFNIKEDLRNMISNSRGRDHQHLAMRRLNSFLSNYYNQLSFASNARQNDTNIYKNIEQAKEKEKEKVRIKKISPLININKSKSINKSTSLAGHKSDVSLSSILEHPNKNNSSLNLKSHTNTIKINNGILEENGKNQHQVSSNYQKNLNHFSRIQSEKKRLKSSRSNTNFLSIISERNKLNSSTTNNNAMPLSLSKRSIRINDYRNRQSYSVEKSHRPVRTIRLTDRRLYSIIEKKENNEKKEVKEKKESREDLEKKEKMRYRNLTNNYNSKNYNFHSLNNIFNYNSFFKKSIDSSKAINSQKINNSIHKKDPQLDYIQNNLFKKRCCTHGNTNRISSEIKFPKITKIVHLAKSRSQTTAEEKKTSETIKFKKLDFLSRLNLNKSKNQEKIKDKDKEIEKEEDNNDNDNNEEIVNARYLEKEKKYQYIKHEPDTIEKIFHYKDRQNIYLLHYNKNKFPKHPRTLYFMNEFSTPPQFLLENEAPETHIKMHQIVNKYYMCSVRTYPNPYPCIKKTFDSNEFVYLTNFEHENVVWVDPSILHMEIIRSLQKYQKYNHFPFTHELGRKDRIYMNYSKMKEKFPEDYNYMIESYIMPNDKEKFIEKIGNRYRVSDDNMWIIKPVNAFGGTGVHILQDLDDLNCGTVKKEVKTSLKPGTSRERTISHSKRRITRNIKSGINHDSGGSELNSNSNIDKRIVVKYISHPYLINHKKFDLRFYTLITGFFPLKIYLYKEGIVRFASVQYTLDPCDLQNSFIHLTNVCINKKFKGNNGHTEKWLFPKLEQYLTANKKSFSDLFNKVKDIIIKAVISIFDKALIDLKYGFDNLGNNNCFELYGFDILIDHDFKPYLLEMNNNPMLSSYANVDLQMKTSLICDVLNLAGIVLFDHKTNKPLDKGPKYEDSVDEAVEESLCEFSRCFGKFERIFPLKDNIDYYSRFIDEPRDENLKLWEKLKEAKSE